MRSHTYVIIACTLLLSGCDIIRTVLPRHSTTTFEARAALQRCGIVPDNIAWSVSDDGTFGFGSKSPDAAPMSGAQYECLMRWVEDNRIKIAFIGWEAGPR